MRIAEPKKQIPKERQRFSNQKLKEMIVPVVIEQFLTLLVGMIDTMMISGAGDAAVSGVSLVNQISILCMMVFTAMATGGTIITAQYIGRKDCERASASGSQMIMLASAFAVIMSAVLFIFGARIFLLLFGHVETDVYEAGILYQNIVLFSFPFIAVYSCCGGLFRSMGETRTVMLVSAGMNLINIVGNYIGVYILRIGVAGVAYPTLISRIFAAAMLFALSMNRERQVFVQVRYLFSFNKDIIGRILRVALPSGLESALFQLSKVAVSSIVALFGTAQIAANGVAQSFWSICSLFIISMGPAFTTVIGQYMGAGDEEGADYYMRKLLRITYAGDLVWCAVMFILSPLILRLFTLSPEAHRLALIAIELHTILQVPVGTAAFPFAAGIRAAGDVRYVTAAAVFSTVIVRVAASVLLGIVLDWKLLGIVVAMSIDWTVKAGLLFCRYRSGKWKSFCLI